MTERQVELGKAYLEVIKKQNKRKIHIDNLERVKRRLFSNKPEDIHVLIPPPEETVYFWGHKNLFDEFYSCQTCYVLNIGGAPTQIEVEIKLHESLSTGELTLKEFNAKGLDRDDLQNCCCCCTKRLTYLRPYDSNHLDFKS